LGAIETGVTLGSAKLVVELNDVLVTHCIGICEEQHRRHLDASEPLDQS
jgi:hypothetical protein